MPRVIDLSTEHTNEFTRKYVAYKNASDTARAEEFFNLLLWTYKTIGKEMTQGLLRKETKNDPTSQQLLLQLVIGKAEEEE